MWVLEYAAAAVDARGPVCEREPAIRFGYDPPTPSRYLIHRVWGHPPSAHLLSLQVRVVLVWIAINLLIRAGSAIDGIDN